MGGRTYYLISPDGAVTNWTRYGHLGRAMPGKPPVGGRWRWTEDGREIYR